MALNDGMSVVLKKITAALDTTLSSFEQIQRLSGNAMDVAEIEAARGALADASNAVDEMADNYRRAAQEEERLNQGIHEGASALDGMVTKVVSLVGAYMSLSAIKGFATSSMDAANIQINAQRQLRTVLDNMGAEDDFNALVDETSGNTLENVLALDISGAAGSYEALADLAGSDLESTFALDTAGAMNGYADMAKGVDGTELSNALALDAAQARDAIQGYGRAMGRLDGASVETDLTLDAAGAAGALAAYGGMADQNDGREIWQSMAVGAEWYWKDREGPGAAVPESAVVLDTARAMDSYERLADTIGGAELDIDLDLGTAEAMDRYAGLTGEVDGAELDNTLALDVGPARAAYDAFCAGIEGGRVGVEVRADTAQAVTAYEAILDKASQIQSSGIYGDEIMIAGAAEFATYFTDPDAILSMMDTLTDYAMGMSGGGALDAAAMVDYATNLGKIMSGSFDAMKDRGFEFTDAQKAIIEGTATEAQIVAELGEGYLGMSRDMQAAAAIDAVIAEGWGGLYEAMSDTPEGKLIQLDNTLGDIKENVGAGIYPAVMSFVDVIQTNAPQIEAAAMGLATVLGFAISLLTGMAEGAVSFGAAVSDNWSWIEPIVYGIVAALGAYVGYLSVMKAMELASAAGKIVMCAASYAHAAATGTEASTTAVATAAQYGLNTALLACPITWIVVAVIALVAGIMALCNWIAKTTGVAQTGFGVLTGGINVVIQAVVNAGLVVSNIALGIWNALGAVCSNIGTAFHNVISNVQSWFYGLLSTALTVVAGICEALNKLPFVEFDYSGITSKADEYAARSAEAANSKEGYTSVADAFSEGFGTFDAYSEGWASDAFQAGAAWGDSVADKVGGMFDGLGYEPGTIEDFANQGFDSFAMDGLGNDVGAIADNTGGMAHALDVSGEELRYLRDIAERDAIDRFTTAEVKIDMTGMTNKIDSSNDLDGVIRELTDGFSEALVTAAEGVHE